MGALTRLLANLPQEYPQDFGKNFLGPQIQRFSPTEDSVRRRKNKVDRDLRFHFNRLAVQPVGAKAPLPYCVERCSGQQWMSAHQVQALDAAVARNECADYH